MSIKDTTYLKKLIFVDLDGTLVESSGKYIEPFWGETEAIQENVDFLNSVTLETIGFAFVSTRSCQILQKFVIFQSCC